jgi:hypothetical protein
MLGGRGSRGIRGGPVGGTRPSGGLDAVGRYRGTRDSGEKSGMVTHDSSSSTSRRALMRVLTSLHCEAHARSGRVTIVVTTVKMSPSCW